MFFSTRSRRKGLDMLAVRLDTMLLSGMGQGALRRGRYMCERLRGMRCLKSCVA